MLERVGRQSLERSCLEDCVILPFGVSFKGKNDRSFKDSERTMVEFKCFYFKTLYH
jgi:hypothetical protein